jgi:hypothetical protein
MDVEGTTNEKPTSLNRHDKGPEKGSPDTATPAADVSEFTGVVAETPATEFETRVSPVLECPDYMSMHRANELQGLLNTWFPDYQVQVGKVFLQTSKAAEQVGVFLDGGHIGDVYASGVGEYENRIDFNDFRSKVARFIEKARLARTGIPATEPLDDPTQV